VKERVSGSSARACFEPHAGRFYGPFSDKEVEQPETELKMAGDAISRTCGKHLKKIEGRLIKVGTIEWD
jgi:hypothetical protein